MFYKNILETIPIYMYGVKSRFSGLVIYDSIMYVTFNLCFTSWPIIHFATMDYEYPKKVIAKRPQLYRIGLDNIYFSKWVFWRWVFYAFWQSSLILFLAYYALENESPLIDGRYGGVYVSGNLVFMMLVIVSNMKILISSFLITYLLLFFVLGSVGFYYFVYVLEAGSMTTSEQYGTLLMLMSSAQSYFVIILFTFMFVLVDTGLHYLNIYINKWYELQLEKAKQLKQKKDMKSKSVIKRKLSTYKNRGFAFS
mmetsp:Transcript_6511/g.7803  ORF Transcript_6511/g.7803 Transcript_6511/m.7803 type:complete len:253 (+) Transcript_6511:2820-3578(+)